jgi:hypothetical protein
VGEEEEEEEEEKPEVVEEVMLKLLISVNFQIGREFDFGV